MAVADEITDLLNTGYFGQTVTVARNTPSYTGNNDGAPSDSWASAGTPNADIQPIGGSSIKVDIGEQKTSTHRIFFPNGTDIKQGDRVRPAGWATGNDEYEVDAVLSEFGHVEVAAHLVVGNA